MKNTLKVLGIIALVAVIGFGVVACQNSTSNSGGSGGGTGGTYTHEWFNIYKESGITDNDFQAIFGDSIPEVENAKVITGPKTGLDAKYEAAKKAEGYSYQGHDSSIYVTYSYIENQLETEATFKIMTESQRTEFLNALKTNGASMVALRFSDDKKITAHYYYKK